LRSKAFADRKVGEAFVDRFNDPRTFFPWLADPAEAEKFIEAA